MNGLLMDSIRKIDELAQFRKRIPHGRLYVVPKKALEGEELEPEEQAVLAQVNGERTVIEVGQRARFAEFDATRIVHHLIELGLAKVSESPLATAPVTSAPSEVVTAPAPAAPAPAPKPVLTAEKIVTTFNVIFREVRDEVAQRETLEPFLISANAALKGNGVSTSPVLNGLMFSDDGVLPGDALIARYGELSAAGKLGPEPLVALKQALSDVMFFLLFQAGELLESAADEQLAGRVKEHLATLDLK
jgi:hypothetical protein